MIAYLSIDPSSTVEARELVRAALSDLLTLGLDRLVKLIDERPRQPETGCLDDTDDEIVAATEVLGVTVNATGDEIRAALRNRMTTACVHPDQGGNPEWARKLIDAKNLLLARARERERTDRSHDERDR